MAASCIPVTATAASSLVAVRSAKSNSSRQTARHRSATPSVSSSCNAVSRNSASGLSVLSFASRSASYAARDGVLARAVELGETKGESLLSEEESDDELSADASSPVPAPTTKLYVGNLPWSVDSKQLAEIVQEYGNVELVEVIYDRDTQRSRGFAFVTMRTGEDAERVIEALGGYEIEGRVLKVNFPQAGKPYEERRRSDRSPRDGGGNAGNLNKMFVGNLSWGVDDVALAQLYSEYGQVVEAKVVHDRETGRSRGFAFVTMSTASEVDMAIQALDGAEFDGRILRVNRADDKPVRRDSPRREY